MTSLTTLIWQVPSALVAIFFVVTAITRMGKERGAGVFLLGAIGLCAMALINPVFNAFVVPGLMNSGSQEQLRAIMTSSAIFFTFGQILSVGLLAVGTLMRGGSSQSVE